MQAAFYEDALRDGGIENASTPTRLPGALGDWSRSCNRSWASAVRYGNSPSADHAVGTDASNPACVSAVGQSRRRSMPTLSFTSHVSSSVLTRGVVSRPSVKQAISQPYTKKLAMLTK